MCLIFIRSIPCNLTFNIVPVRKSTVGSGSEALIFVQTVALILVNELAQDYAEKYTSRQNDLLREVAERTEAHPQAHMFSGKVQGRFLEFISGMLAPARILEIGTFTGYSALCLASGLIKNGLLHTIEVREEEASVAKGYFDRSEWRNQIILHVGNALEIIPALDEPWDLVFIDADKVNYAAYYKLVLTKLRKGGVIIADNVLFHGEVLEEPVKSKNAEGIKIFNDLVIQDSEVENVLLTIRDGLMMIRKK